MFPHAYYSEFVQTIAAGLGFGLGIWAVWDAWGEGLYWRSVVDEERKMGRATITTEARYDISKVHFISELATVVVQTVFLVAGVSGLFLAPPDGYARNYDQELMGIAISRYSMVFATAVLAFKSIIRRRGRILYVRARRGTDGVEVVSPPSAMVPRCDD